jgi:hypothetical protein
MQDHAKIIAALRGGDRTSALADIERLLAAEPGNSELLGLKGLALAVGGQLDEAADCARLAMLNAATPAQRIKHAGNLARLLARGDRRQDLAALPEMDLPHLDVLADDAIEAIDLENLCAPLLAAGAHDFVATFLQPTLDWPGVTWKLEQLWLTAAVAAEKNEAILARFDAPGYRWRDKPEAIAIASATADVLGRQTQGKQLYLNYLATVPPYATSRAPTQILSIVVLATDPSRQSLRTSGSVQNLGDNFPSQLPKYCGDRYRLFCVFAGSPLTSARALLDRHEAAITLNNCVNGEDLKRGQLVKAEAHQQALGLPVVNDATKAVHCTRVETADMLRGIPNLIVPKVMRFRLESQLVDSLRKGIGEVFTFPVILRSVGEQEGANVHLASNPTDLGAVLRELLELGSRDFYVIEYAGVKHKSGFYRRIRAAFVEGTPTLIRGDYDDQWMVRGRKFERILDHYRRDPALFNDANAVVQQPQRIGDAAWNTLAEVGRRIPLDVFGMDFDVDDDGRVIFFESNATMLLLSNAPPELNYPQDAQQAFLKRLDALFLKRAGISLQ